MRTQRPLTIAVLAATLAALSACGGDGGSAPPPAAAPPPSTGAYGWVLKAEGATSQLKYGLSLVHAASSGTEYIVEAASDAVTDAKPVSSGTVDGASGSVGSLSPYTLVYIVGGDVRRVPLQANGLAPKTQVQRALSTAACRFVIDAIDHAAPEQSRFIVSTAGADGVCDTADDGRAEVRLQAAAPGVVFTPLAAPAPLSALRDPATLAPRGWVYPTEVVLWGPSPGSAFTFRGSGNAVTRVVDSTYRTLLVESASGLSLLDFGGGTAFADTPLAGVAGSGWQAIGYDRQYHYAWRNSGDESGSWQVIRVARSAPLATVLASGGGEVTVGSLGRDQIYLTVFTAGSNQLLRLPKAVPGANVAVLETTGPTTLSTVVTSGSDVHQLWRVTGVGSSAPGYTVEMVDESGARLFTSSGGGFPLLLAGGTTWNFDASENRTRFVIANGYGSRAYSGASLVAYDAVAHSAVVIGTLPGAAAYGDDFVFANVSGGSGSFMTGFAARSVGGVVQGTGTQVFSFDAATAASLKTTTAQQP